jgi:hypothetical protein
VKIDKKTNSFSPPSKQLSFNQQSQTKDGSLANYVPQTDGTSYEAALEKIRNASRQIKQELHQSKKVYLKNLGDLSVNSQGAIVFEPENKVNYLPESFGLASFISPAISRQVNEKIAQKPVVVLASEKRTIPYFRYAAIGLITLGIAGFGSLYLYNTKVLEHNLAGKHKTDAIVETQIQQATFVINSPLPSLKVAVKKESGNYHLVAGAFRQEENALSKVADLKEQGYPARSIGENKYGLHQVVYGRLQ